MKQSWPVPAFLTKLWTLVDDRSTNQLVRWSSGGSSFLIVDQLHFSKDVLPLYYKHSNITSFIRQLNMYGFHKVAPVSGGLLKEEGQDCVEFQHEFFTKDQPHLLTLIKRKVSVSRGVDDAGQVSQVLVEISHVRGLQDSVDFKLMALCRDNESLWRELTSLKKKQQQQHTVIRKIMQLIVDTVQSGGVRGLKRNLPMIDSSGPSHSPPKCSRLSETSTDVNLSSAPIQQLRPLLELPLDSGPEVSDVCDITNLLEPLPELDSGAAVESAPCCPSTLYPPLSPVDLPLSLLDDPQAVDAEDKLLDKSESDQLSLIDSSLTAIQASPFSPSLEILSELLRINSWDSETHTAKKKRDRKRATDTQTGTYTVATVRSQQLQDLSFTGEMEEADFLPSLLQLVHEAAM
ncbi:heat shock factor protein 1 [Hoplias malabaricus]|uniref:heat shock factor protein 1 n=1 Tax=Hoplias malabaricus TaxID=27720 RepID=UPI003463197B